MHLQTKIVVLLNVCVAVNRSGGVERRGESTAVAPAVPQWSGASCRKLMARKKGEKALPTGALTAVVMHGLSSRRGEKKSQCV